MPVDGRGEGVPAPVPPLPRGYATGTIETVVYMRVLIQRDIKSLRGAVLIRRERTVVYERRLGHSSHDVRPPR